MRTTVAASALVVLAAISVGAALVSDGGPDRDRAARPVASSLIPTRAPTPSSGPTVGATDAATIPFIYVNGTLLETSPTSFSIATESGTREYPLDGWTQICRRSCSEAWPSLEVGSRIDGVVDFLTTGPHARWLNVNSWSDWAEVEAVDGERIIRHTTRFTPQVDGPYTLVIGPDTTIDPAGALRVGDRVYLAGSSQGPDDRSVVFGLLVSRSVTSR